MLSGISFQLERGTILGIAGENGAGKSTLVKSICGLLKPASGTIERTVPASAIHQEFNLAPDLTVAENIFLGREPACCSMLRLKIMAEKAEELLASLGAAIAPETLVSTLTVAEKQMVEIAKAVSSDAGILIMDEPTTVLNNAETERLFKLVRHLTAQGKAVIYISHKLEEVLALCGKVMVLRDGEMAGIYQASELTPGLLAEKMVGRELNRLFPPKLPEHSGVVKLEVEHLCARGVKDISFSLHAGEILGVAGLNGAGRSELAEALFGLRKITSGTVKINGESVKIKSAQDALKKKIAFLTEDRQGSGLLLDFPIESNFTPTNSRRGCRRMEKSEKEKKIKKETNRLKKIFAGLEPNKLKAVDALIARAAFITVSLQELEQELNEKGWTEVYINGKNQEGIKKAAAAEAHISLTKNLTAIMKQLLDLVPPAQKESRLAAMMGK